MTKDISMSYWQNFGSVFTGIGLLGTFLGLVLGLEGVDLSSSDVIVLKEGIGALLKGIYIAFGTSLVGILCALVYGALTKIEQDALSKNILMLAQRVEDMYPRKTIEQWLSDGNRESVEQTKAIKNLAQETAESLGELLDRQLSTGFEELCDKLDAQMKPTFEKLYEAISALNEGGANAIAGAVNEKTGTQLDAFARTLQNMQESMQHSLDSSANVSAQANALLTETMERISISITNGTDEAVKKQQVAADLMNNQTQELVRSLNSSSEQAMANMLNASTVAQQGLNDSVEQTKASAQAILNSLENIVQAQSDLMQKSTESNKKRTDETITMLQQTIQEHSSAVGQSYVAIKDMAMTLEQVLEQVDISGRNLKDSVAPIKEATDSLNLQLRIIQSQTDKLHEEIGKQLNDMAKQGVETKQSISALSSTIDNAQKQALEAWSEYNQGFKGIGDELGSVLDGIADKLTNYNQIMNDGMKTHLSEFDGSVAQATGQLKSVIEELNDMIEDMMRQRMVGSNNNEKKN